MAHEVEMGKLRKRMSFSRIDEVLEMPDLIEVQKNSYQRFLDTDLREVLADASPITDYNGTLELTFTDYSLGEPKNSMDRCRERDMTYAAPLNVHVHLFNSETSEIKETDVYMGDFPLMTENGTFIINGAERVIVSQLVRSPGCYFSRTLDKAGLPLYSAQIIPNRGAWLEYETDSNNIMWVRLDRARKLCLTVLLRALGYESDQQIVELLGDDKRLTATLSRDNTLDEASKDRGGTRRPREQALLEIYKKQKPGEPESVESATNLFRSLFYDPKRYDVMRVGRYKFNKKLSLATRINKQVAAEDVIDPRTGEIMVTAGEIIDLDTARRIQNAGVNSVTVDVEGEKRKVVGNNFVDAREYLPFDPREAGILEMVHLPTLKRIIESVEPDQLKQVVADSVAQLVPKHILDDDIVASVSYMLGLPYGIGATDDIDHLGNRRLRSVGELLQNQIRIGLSRLERTVKERMSVQDTLEVNPGDLINIRPVTAAIKEFFGSSQLSQFMDQCNPLAELTHKRRLSALGPGGLNRDRASFEVRDVHYSHYSRICPIETPEGPNIGLIGSLATYARINEYGFVEAPYRKVDKENRRVTDEVLYMTADEEDFYKVATASEPLDDNNVFVNELITVRDKTEYVEVPGNQVDFVDVSPRQVVSVATGMIPFLENDDATRALMGSNMQRQAVPLLVPEAPLVGTGLEFKAGQDSGVVILAREDGVVEKVAGDEIVIRDEYNECHRYKLTKFARTNQSNCANQRPVVSAGQKVQKGDLLADGPATEKGEIALGRNALIGVMTWEGYNYEDAVLLSEKLVKEDIYTSIHMEEFECEARETKLGPEEITRDIPNISDDAVKDLDENGIIRIGAEVHAGDILVGKVTPKGETELTAEERLLRAIFGEKAREVRDTSLRVPHGEWGVVVDVKIFTRENKDEMSPGVNEMVRVYIAQKRKISVGDKMAGRHGNKGVVSRVLREEDMPFLPDGTPLQIVLNPLGVPSRMNIGQVLEVHLGLACRALGWHIATPVFDGATYPEIRDCLEKAACTMEAPFDENDPHMTEYHFHNGKPLRLDLNEEDRKLFLDGKLRLRDGRTGNLFENPVTVGVMYFLKLHHLVDDKMHARSVGPYSLVTQQPLGGKAQFGGQRFGEMEVWALEAYGAANTLQEILTVKSDDTVGRVKTYEAIIKGENIPAPGVPESFKVLIKELQALCLDIKVLDADKNVIEIPELDPEDMAPAESTRPMREEDPAESDAPAALADVDMDDLIDPEFTAADFALDGDDDMDADVSLDALRDDLDFDDEPMDDLDIE
ncbi:MAG: DNA-directed RNA polymerase subunit beta [Clostridia bacterium]|nr:DNA-directed RNA polymerase subunit beta [Clostridia bacterium]